MAINEWLAFCFLSVTLVPPVSHCFTDWGRGWNSLKVHLGKYQIAISSSSGGRREMEEASWVLPFLCPQGPTWPGRSEQWWDLCHCLPGWKEQPFHIPITAAGYLFTYPTSRGQVGLCQSGGLSSIHTMCTQDPRESSFLKAHLDPNVNPVHDNCDVTNIVFKTSVQESIVAK